MRGNDLRNHAVGQGITLPDGRIVRMIFCFETFAIAEEIYREVFDTDKDIIGIIDDLSENMPRAIMAVAYAACAVADKSITIECFAKDIFIPEYEKFFHTVIVTNLSKMFRDVGGEPEEPDEVAEFQWDAYYLTALRLGMSDADFWACTPKKIWLLTRDKEEEERRAELSRLYV